MQENSPSSSKLGLEGFGIMSIGGQCHQLEEMKEIALYNSPSLTLEERQEWLEEIQAIIDTVKSKWAEWQDLHKN